MIDVAELTARLYSSAPEDFVKVRGEGAKQLKAAGQQDAAVDFAKLAKPSFPAWAVNLLVTQRSDVIDDIVRHGEELRDAHTGGGGAKQIRAAHQARQDAVRRAAEVAVDLTGRDVSAAHRGEIAATLEAASSDPSVAAEVRRAQLVRPLEAPTGFGTLDRLTVIPGGKAGRRGDSGARRTKDTADEDDDDAADDKARQARASMLRADADAALGDAEAAAEAVSALRERVAALENQRDELRDELQRLDDELTGTRRQLRDAERDALSAARKATRAASRADRAEP
jgi:hypothetical protein